MGLAPIEGGIGVEEGDGAEDGAVGATGATSCARLGSSVARYCALRPRNVRVPEFPEFVAASGLATGEAVVVGVLATVGVVDKKALDVRMDELLKDELVLVV